MHVLYHFSSKNGVTNTRSQNAENIEITVKLDYLNNPHIICKVFENFMILHVLQICDRLHDY